jgi:hypothetical protein
MYKQFFSIGDKLHQKFLSAFATFIAVVVIALPVIGVCAASSSYSFTMTYSIVDGCANNQLHTLDAGTGKLTGSAYALHSTIPVWYELQREVFGPNPSYGSINGSINTAFNMAFPTSVVSASNYCIIAYRNGFDGFTVNGSGTLHN